METMNPSYSLDPRSVRRTPSYSEVFGRQMTEAEIKAFVSELDMYSSISIICELLSLRDKDLSIESQVFWWMFSIKTPFDLALKQLFLQNCQDTQTKLTAEGVSLLNPADASVKFITLQSLLIALKLLLAYGNYNTLDKKEQFSIDDYCRILTLSLIATDSLDADRLDPSHFIYGNYHVNQIYNIGSEILRAYDVFCVIGSDKANFPVEEQGEYLDFNADFFEKYGYEISDYLAVLFLFSERYIDDDPHLSYGSIFKNIDTAYEACNNSEHAKAVIRSLALDLTEAKQWAKDSLEYWWDFSVFMDKPIILLPNGDFTSISDRTIINGFYEKLFWHIRACYTEDDRKFNSFIGRPFEQYVQAITREAVSSNEVYSYQPEFYFSTRESTHNASSDSYIIKGNKMIAVEAKSFGPLFDSIRYGDEASIQASIEKLFVKPVIQAEKINQKIISSGDYPFFNGITELIILSVTVDSVQAVPEYYNTAMKAISSQSTLEIFKYCLNLSVREYEYLLSMIENGKDVFCVLETYLSQGAIQPFMAYAMEISGHSIVRTAYMEKLFSEYTSKLHDRLF